MSHELNQAFEEEELPTVTVFDEAGRSLTCYLEHTVEIEEQSYLLLLPVDHPVEIFAWKGSESEDDDEEEIVPIEDAEELDRVFPIAKAVLAEHNLQLKHTAVTLTIGGELPDLDEDEEAEYWENQEDEDDGGSEVQLLVNFYCEEQEYGIYTPLDPMFIPVRLDQDGQPQLLSAEEFRKIEPLLPALLQEKLFEELD